MLKRLGVIPSIALAHFVVCIGVISFTRTMGTGAADNIQAAYGIFKIMAGLTRILYFPIISCALYSRSWFPGNWIYILIFVNSLVWGGGVYLVFVLFRKVCRRS
ncbi:MAG: hypothetical protein JSW39_12825 [Desulfobacterales bacterium]|nr:MAG: hypothetical protein JSW39_12825 [Desulfobacterales bacterium]